MNFARFLIVSATFWSAHGFVSSAGRAECLECIAIKDVQVIAYESKTTDAQMIGFSGYDDGGTDVGDYNYDHEGWPGQGKKWKIKTLSGYHEYYYGIFYYCDLEHPLSAITEIETFSIDGEVEIGFTEPGISGIISYAEFEYFDGFHLEGTGDAYSIFQGGYTFNDPLIYPPGRTYAVWNRADAEVEDLTSVTVQYNDELGACDGYTYHPPCSASESLSEPDGLRAALNRAGEPTTGNYSTAFFSIDATSPEIESPIAITKRKVTVVVAACDGEYDVMADLMIGKYGGRPDPDGEGIFAAPIKIEKEVKVKENAQAKNGELRFEIPLDEGESEEEQIEAGLKKKIVSIVSGSIRLIPKTKPNFGESSSSQGSVHFSLDLGSAEGGGRSGLISVDEEDLTSSSFTPEALKLYAVSSSLVVIRDGSDNLRQIVSPEGLVDIETVNSTSYAVHVYRTDQVGAADPMTHIRSLSGDPFVSYVFSEAEGASSGDVKLSIVETRGAISKETSFTQNGETWEMEKGGGLYVERKTVTFTAGGRIETVEIKEAGGPVVKTTAKEFHTFPFGDRVIEETVGSGADAETVTFSYYDDALDGMSYGREESRQTSAGNWETLTYDSEGRRSKHVRQFLDTAFNSSDSLNRVTLWDYSLVDDIDEDGKGEELECETEYLLGQETRRVYHLALTATNGGGSVPAWKEERVITTTLAGDDWDDEANLVTVSRIGQEGRLKNRTLWEQSPAGVTTTLAFDEVNRKWISEEGVSPDPVRRTEVTEDELGRETNRDVYEGSLLVESREVLESDDAGRPTLIGYLDGTQEEFIYACCGLEQFRDRDGVLTVYGRDDLGRVDRETVGGVVTAYAYDAAGRRIETARIDENDDLVPILTETYSDSGRRLSSVDALSNTTLYEEEQLVSGLIQRTTIYADEGEMIESFYPDGSQASIRGNAVPWKDYAYGVDSEGDYEQELLPRGDEGSSPAAQWVKRYTNQFGQTSKVVYPDDSEEIYSYDPAGRLAGRTDPDGVRTLFGYDSRGLLTVTAIDLDDNGEIDLDTDRVSRTATVATTRAGSPSVTVLRTTNEIWEADEDDTSTVVSETDVAVGSLQQWRTAYGVSAATTHNSKSLDGLGGRTETTIYPDGTRTIGAYANGRLVTESRKDSSEALLSETTRAYDDYGRLETQTSSGVGTTTYIYYADDSLQSVETPDPGTGAQTTHYEYTERGWLKKVTQPDDAETETSYYPTGQVKRKWGARTYPVEYAYDAQGRLKTLTTWRDFAGTSGAAVTTWHYDEERGWLDNKEYADGDGPSYTYTDAGRPLTRVWARGITTTYGYTDAGELGSLTYSDGTTPNVSHTYDRAGRPLVTTDGAGTLTRSYENGALKDEIYTGAGLLSGTNVIRAFDSILRPSTLALSGYLVGYGYDELSGRLETVSQLDPVSEHELHRAKYDYKPSVGGVESVTIRRIGIDRVKHVRDTDALGRVTKVRTYAGAALQMQRDYAYNDANQRTRIDQDLYAPAAERRVWAIGYDDLGQVETAQKRLADGTTPLPGHTFAYEFDDIGNRISTTVNSRGASYTLDEDGLNQYTARVIPGALDVRGQAATDAVVTVNTLSTTRTGKDFYRELSPSLRGNVSITVDAVRAGPPLVSATNSFTTFLAQTPEAFVHDEDGNLTLDALWDYTWDAENRLTRMQTSSVAALAGAAGKRIEFRYDSQGRRLQKKVSSAVSGGGWTTVSDLRFVYDGWNLLIERDNEEGMEIVRTHVWGIDLSGGMQGAGGVGGLLWSGTPTHTFAASSDANGNIVAYINTATLDVAGRADYSAFGESILRTGVMATQSYGDSAKLPFAFSSKYEDAETGLDYYGFRYYNPNTGRWPNRDPIEDRGGHNLYVMAGNNTIDRWDVLGLRPGQLYYTKELAKAAAGREVFGLTREDANDGFSRAVGDIASNARFMRIRWSVNGDNYLALGDSNPLGIDKNGTITDPRQNPPRPWSGVFGREHAVYVYKVIAARAVRYTYTTPIMGRMPTENEFVAGKMGRTEGLFTKEELAALKHVEVEGGCVAVMLVHSHNVKKVGLREAAFDEGLSDADVSYSSSSGIPVYAIKSDGTFTP